MAFLMPETKPPAAPALFTPAERDYIRHELDMFFSTLPSVADGFQLSLTLAFSGWVACGFGEAVEERAWDCCHVLGVQGR